jgi:2-polyprenyl-6-hydroxyphenyl methylase / 3-demethylubiquinone-9 3-methyltransferase
MASAPTVDADDVRRFAALAEEWWNPGGAFRPLHRLNPVRIGFIRDRLVRHFERPRKSVRPFGDLSLLDIGCGGGLLSEPMARLGFAVTGIDAALRNIAIAKAHAAETGLAVDYRHETVEALAASGAGFDVVLAMEVVEHVADLTRFLADAARLVRPGGALVAATLNRTAKSFLFAIVGAEYVLRWLPRGTHRWESFVRPSELIPRLRRGGLRVEEITGVTYDPLIGAWSLTRDLDVNYMLWASRLPS